MVTQKKYPFCPSNVQKFIEVKGFGKHFIGLSHEIFLNTPWNVVL